MVALISVNRKSCHWLIGALLVLAAPAASAGPGFIESTRVSGDASGADIEIRFNCKTQYLRHEPQNGGDLLRIYLDPTSICNGVSPLVADSRTLSRPVNSDIANLVDVEYDGDSTIDSVLTLRFNEPVAFTVDMSSVSFNLVVHVQRSGTQTESPILRPAVKHQQVVRPQEESPDYIINLTTLQRVPTVADVSMLQLTANQHVHYAEAEVNGATWYLLRLGNFESATEATSALGGLSAHFPGAWIDQVDTDAVTVELTTITDEATASTEDLSDIAELATDAAPLPSSADDSTVSKVDALMAQARSAMVAGETSRAIQIYTKVLQMPADPRQAEAQEFLALAREKNGQTAHAKAEYQRYLSLYPETEGAARVSQRLAALLASGRQSSKAADTSDPQSIGKPAKQSDWRVQTFFSQYYRRDANQQSNEDEIISQSALYSDVNLDARRRGERFDFSSRLSAGYRNDFLAEERGSGNALRVSYAYADLADAATGLRGRIGRQSRNTGGVLGRFDGLNLGYQFSERVLLNTVVGKPTYSSSNSIDTTRSFYGASINYGPVLENLDLGLFYIAQEIEGIQDRQAVGAEFRYFGTNQSFWGMADYDVSFGELASAFLQGSWRFPSRLSIHAHADRRGSPFLSTGNAMIGQPVTSFADLAVIFSEDELRQLSQDRTAVSTTFTVGLSYPLTPKLQVNADASQSTMDGTPASGGILATDGASYSNYSGSLIASGLFKEGDVSIISARYSDSDTTKVISLTIDSRYPIGRTWRINPRLRVDRRQRMLDSSYEWLYTPGIRVHYRRSQKFRITLEAGKQFSQRETAAINLDRESYFINLGYQAFF